MKQISRNLLFSLVGLALVLEGWQVSAQHDACKPEEHLMDPPECPESENLPTYFPYPYDCTKFFECTNGDARCIQCPNATRWDQNLTVCNHESVIDCVIVPTTAKPITTTTTPTTTTPTTTTPTTTTPTTTTPTTTTPTTTTPTTTTPTTTTPTTTTPTTTTPTTTTPTTTTPTTTTPTTTTTTTTTSTTVPPPTTTEDPIEWICEEGYEGPIGHPYDCSLFYICDPGRRPCLFECTSGLYWSPITKNCEWPHDVPSCQGGTPPPPTSRAPMNYRNSPRFDMETFISSFLKKQSEGEDPCVPAVATQLRY